MRYNELKALYVLSISGVIENAWGKWSSPDFIDIHFSTETISSLIARQLAVFHVFGGHGQQAVYSTHAGDMIADILDEELKKAGENPDDFVLHNKSSSYKLYHSGIEKERIFRERRKEITKAVNRRLKNMSAQHRLQRTAASPLRVRAASQRG